MLQQDDDLHPENMLHIADFDTTTFAMWLVIFSRVLLWGVESASAAGETFRFESFLIPGRFNMHDLAAWTWYDEIMLLDDPFMVRHVVDGKRVLVRRIVFKVMPVDGPTDEWIARFRSTPNRSYRSLPNGWVVVVPPALVVAPALPAPPAPPFGEVEEIHREDFLLDRALRMGLNDRNWALLELRRAHRTIEIAQRAIDARDQERAARRA